MCFNSSRGELWLINVWWWAMWGHTFTNHNSSRGELWHKVVGNYVILSLLLASLTKKSQLSLLKKNSFDGQERMLACCLVASYFLHRVNEVYTVACIVLRSEPNYKTTVFHLFENKQVKERSQHSKTVA